MFTEDVHLVNGRLPSKRELIVRKLGQIMEANVTESRIFEQKFKPNPTQKMMVDIIDASEVPEDKWLHLLCYGSTGSGKSYGIAAYVIEQMLKHPGCSVLAVRTTVTDIKETIYKDFLKILNKFGVKYTKNDTDTSILFNNGSTLRCRSDKALMDSHSDKSHSLGGTAYNFVLFEEADSISQELIATIAGRMRAPGNYRKVIFYSCNPPSKRHWLWKMFHEGNDPHDPHSRRRAIFFTTEDNVQHVGTGYMEAMREDFGIANPNLLKRLGFGLPGADTKGIPYYAHDFRRDIHVSDKKLVWDPAYPMLRGWDFGLSSGIVVAQWHPDLNQLRCFQAHLGQEILFDPWCDQVLPKIIKDFPGAQWEDYCDVAGKIRQANAEKSYFELMKERGLRPRYPKKRGLVWSLNRVSTLLRTMWRGMPKVILDPDCEILIEGFEGGYCNMKGIRDDDVRPMKDGVFDHIMDAFRYITMCVMMDLDEGVNTNRIGFVEPDLAGLFQQDFSNAQAISHGLIRGAVSAPSRNPFGRR